MHPSWNQHPRLLAELDPNGNMGFTHRGKPVSVLELAAGTNKSLDWICSTCGHKWKTTGNNRVSGGKGCPPCRRKQGAENKRKYHLEKNGSMAETHPELAKDYVGDSTQIIAETGDKLDWKCHVCSHEWQAYGYSRASGIGCPYCSATNTPIHSDGRNSLATMFPELASEYQGDATQVLYTTEKNLLWKCRNCDHEWRANARNRTLNKSGCPFCNKGVLHSDGRNSMAMTNPELAAEYQGDATKIIAGTHQKLPWKCSTCNHEWIVPGSNRSRGSGCPSCAIYGFNPNEPAYYYVHEIINESGDRLYYKAGISKNWQQRLTILKRKIPEHLTMKNLDYLEFEVGQDAYDLEQQILKQAEEEGWKAPIRDFDGGHELFLENPIDFLNLRSENGS